MVDDLPSGYYLDNFNFVLDFVCQNYQDILTDEELAYRNRFSDLSVDAARLYVRLTSRRGPLFRAEKLAYDEIGDIPVAIENSFSCYQTGTRCFV